LEAEEAKEDVNNKVVKVAASLPPAPTVVRKQLLLSPEEEVKFTAAFDLLDADGDG